MSIVGVGAPTTHAITTVPAKMNFQGRLTNNAGNILPNGTYNMRYRIFNTASAGTALWTETRLVSASAGVTVTNGLFSVQLGDVTPIPASLFTQNTQGTLYFEIELPTPATATTTSPAWTEGAMSPRNQLASSAYAFNSETLDGLDSEAFARIGSDNSYSGVNTFNGITNFGNVTNFADDVVVSGGAYFTSQADGLSFGIASSNGDNLLTADTDTKRLFLGLGNTTSATLFVVSNYNQSGDPPNGSNGSIYYNVVSGKFRCFENAAWKDCITPAPSSSEVTVKLASNVANSTTTLADTGLGFSALSGVTYRFTAFIMYNAAATTTGTRITATGPTFSRFSMRTNQSLTATTEFTNYTAAYNIGTQTATSLTVGNIGTIQGRVTTTAAGTFKLQFASEVAGSAITVLSGSTLTYWVEP